MIEIYNKNQKRFQTAYEKIEQAYRHKAVKELPVIIMDANFAVCGQPEGEIPYDYFTNINTMFNYQIKKIEKHLEQIEDDYIPLLFPWYGTGVVPSALGCEIIFQQGMDPAVGSKIINRPEDVKKLRMPDPYKDGLMPQVLKTIDYMHENSDLPVSFTDCQGPLNIAISLCGVETLFIWMYDFPELVHEIMDFSTEVLIQWIKVQKKHAGQKLDSGAFPHAMVLPEGFGGVWIADDDCTVLSPRLYEEFVVPYNSRVFKAFNGGTLHFCGNAEHQLENFLKIEGLTGINNFCMGNFKQIVRMQEMFEDKLAIMVCDFNPLDIEEYYSRIIPQLKFKGTLLGSFITPELALYNSKYEYVSRKEDEIVRQIKEVIYRLNKR